MDHSASSPSSFKFMDLPVELRLVVYNHLLGGEYPPILVSFRNTAGAHNDKHLKTYSGPAARDKLNNIGILVASRQLWEEAAPILYDHLYDMIDFTKLDKFVKQIRNMRRHVRHIRILTPPFWCTASGESPRLSDELNFHSLTNVRTLSIWRSGIAWKIRVIDLRKVVEDVVPSLKILYERRTRASSNTPPDEVFDILRLEVMMCKSCEPPVFDGDYHDHLRPSAHKFDGMSCDELVKHCEALTAQLRGMLEAALKE